MKKAIATFASKATVGEKYLTKSGVPVTVKSIGSKILVTANATGNSVEIPAGYLLYPYDRTGINKDCLVLMGVRTSQNVNRAAVQYRLNRVGNHRTLKGKYKGKEYTAKVTQDGFEFDGVRFGSLTAIAMKINGGKAVNGPRFFGVKPVARS